MQRWKWVSSLLAAAALAGVLALPEPPPVIAGTANCHIVGEVVDQSGRGLSGVEVGLWISYVGWDGRARFGSATATTDEDGNYTADANLARVAWVADENGDYWCEGVINVSSLTRTNYQESVKGEQEYDGIGESPIGNLMTPSVMVRRK